MQEMMGYTEYYACEKRDFQVIGYRLKNLREMNVSPVPMLRVKNFKNLKISFRLVRCAVVSLCSSLCS